MKKITGTLASMVLIVGMAFFTSCDKLESLADVKFEANMSTDLNVVVPMAPDKSASLTGYQFSESATIDPREDPDIDEYFDKLKRFDVLEVTATVKSVSADPVMISDAEITITSGTETASWPIDLFRITPGRSLSLTNDDGQWDKVNNILNEKKEFTAKINGYSDQEEITFTIEVYIKVQVTANPL
jgi:hypothetical protein